jgi:hypothetical protein
MTGPDDPRSMFDRWDDVEVEVTSTPEQPPTGEPIEDPPSDTGDSVS